MTFKEWLTSYLPDYEDEYSGTLAGMEDAWNAALDAARLSHSEDLEALKSTEFSNAFEG